MDIPFNLFAGRERFEYPEDPDSSRQHLSNFKLSVQNRSEIRMEERIVFFPAGYLPAYAVSLIIYKPGGISFQKGHWSIHGELSYPVLSARSIEYDLSWQSDFYFHIDGGGSSGHAG